MKVKFLLFKLLNKLIIWLDGADQFFLKKWGSRGIYMVRIEIKDLFQFACIDQQKNFAIDLPQINKSLRRRRSKRNKVSIFIGDHGSGKSNFIAGLICSFYGKMPEGYASIHIPNLSAIMQYRVYSTVRSYVSVDFANKNVWVNMKSQIDSYIDKNEVQFSEIENNVQFRGKLIFQKTFQEIIPWQLKDFIFFNGEKLLSKSNFEDNIFKKSLIDVIAGDKKLKEKNYRKVSNKVRKILERLTRKTFIQINSNKRFIVKLKDDFEPIVIDHRGKTDLTKTVSENEISALRLSFSLSVVKLISSHVKFIKVPMVLDNPFSRLNQDSAKRAANIIHKYAPQILLMITPSDVKNGMISKLKNYCGALYKLEKEDNHTIIKTIYNPINIEYIGRKGYYKKGFRNIDYYL